MKTPQIVGIGGFPEQPVFTRVLELAGGDRVLVDHTASPELGDLPGPLPGRFTHFSFFPYPPENLRELALSSDVILVCGGNTANLLAVWRTHGFDRVLREAWQAGVLLTGWSAGMICWFEACVTDSFGLQLDGLRDGLGFLPGSACPHYDGEARRRPVYQRLTREGFPPGIALDDGVAAHYVGTELHRVFTDRPAAAGYRVEDGKDFLLDVVRLTR